MTQDESGVKKEKEKEYGDSAGSASPDTQFADPTKGAPPAEPADREDTTHAAGTADEPDPQGTSADTVSDGPDKESGFYG